jgi:hypothetical protein
MLPPQGRETPIDIATVGIELAKCIPSFDGLLIAVSRVLQLWVDTDGRGMAKCGSSVPRPHSHKAICIDRGVRRYSRGDGTSKTSTVRNSSRPGSSLFVNRYRKAVSVEP